MDYRVAFVPVLVWTALASGIPRASARPVRAPLAPVARSDSTLPDVSDLPLVEVPAAGGSGHTLALVMSGDGDWASFVRAVADTLAASGLPVVGLKSRSYLARTRTPEALAEDVARVLDHYLALWQRDSVVLVGYSRGADFIPLVLNRLPGALRARVRLAAMIGPSQRVTLHFHVIDLVRDVRRPTDIPLLPEAAAMMRTNVPIVCIYGERDRDTLCPSLAREGARVLARPGGHRDPDPAQEAALILSTVRPDGGSRRMSGAQHTA
ncbi:MAG TPA: AcvB/VirJ family lysyl-phosphatidylglycerol hydrolase [Gemmatimonadaceae bacterium]|nr:AcvB/VirJ family lysyl-phosphatidylglycerol hydrolase [Gemmatimonadaceae bacterium]